ncbi:MAG: protein kinase, partial [Acidobacteria bacterium]|nr:protein kinase [Acidobacteriota bacterium]
MPDTHPYALPKGSTLEEYKVVRVLGAGGFGITYLAFDDLLDGPVALKEYFPAEVATRAADGRVAAMSPDQRQVFAWGLDRFIDEARSIRRCRHPNVVRAHRYVKAQGTAYIVMEYVEGESLQAILDERGRLTADEWRRWLDPLLDGLAHVHGHGYLHRDIKPANIVIRAADGEPVLIDFGAARVAARERTHTQVLTPGYAPIEQYSSEGIQGPPTDIHALAAVSYRVLTGKRLPSAPDRVLAGRYEPLAGRIPRAGRAWLEAIDQGLALRPEDRPQTVEEWHSALIQAHKEFADVLQGLSQKLILTPSLEQIIELLTMPTVELVDYINQEVVENPVLEEIPDDSTPAEPAEQADRADADRSDTRDAEPAADQQDAWEDADYEFFGDYLDDGYRARTPTEVKELPPIENTLSTGTSLSDHLLRQLGEQTDDDRLREIGSAIVGNLNDDGYLVASIDEIASMGPWPITEVERVLACVQTLDPIGVAARDLRE